MKTYKIGTRGSLLAVTQTTLMKNKLEEITGDKFEIITIKTQGDEITNKPLWQLEGKDFFTKELDEALLTGAVDMVIHSYKDLGSLRPDGIKLAAITERFFPHDIFLIKKEKVATLLSGKWEAAEFKVGTSSPRRITNLESHLTEFLPAQSSALTIKCEMLRGNVNTRVQKLRDDHYDAIVLAMAGLERLAHLPSSREKLEALLSGLDYMIMPSSEFPSAAAQGALAIECLEKRSDNGELERKLKTLHHQATQDEVTRERKAFASFGGGCHLAVGINVRKVGHTYAHLYRGQHDDKKIHERYLEASNKWDLTNSVFIGLPKSKAKNASAQILWDEAIQKETITPKISDVGNRHFFVTSDYCLETLNTFRPQAFGVWVSGSKTWKKALANHFWPNGSSDLLGHKQILDFQQSELIKILSGTDKWMVLTSDESKTDIGPTIACYKRVWANPGQDFEQKLNSIQQFYWTSFSQYQFYIQRYPQLEQLPRQHFCGLGKTLEEFSKHGVEVTPILDPLL